MEQVALEHSAPEIKVSTTENIVKPKTNEELSYSPDQKRKLRSENDTFGLCILRRSSDQNQADSSLLAKTSLEKRKNNPEMTNFSEAFYKWDVEPSTQSKDTDSDEEMDIETTPQESDARQKLIETTIEEKKLIIQGGDTEKSEHLMLLIEQGHISLNNHEFINLLSCAAKSPSEKMFTVLLKHTTKNGALYPETILSDVCLCGPDDKKIDRCKQLLAKGWSFNERLTVTPYTPYTPLELIARTGADFRSIYQSFVDKLDRSQKFYDALLFGNNLNMIQFVEDHWSRTIRATQ